MRETIKPAYHLAQIKQAFSSVSRLKMTYSAMQGQYALGFSDQDVVDVIQALTTRDFYKSMLPTHSGFVEWQDVYRTEFNGVKIYLKFQCDQRGEMIISFKAR